MKRGSAALSAAAALLLSSAALADDIGLPPSPPPQDTSFEVGIGLGAVHFPDYTGAAARRTVVLPFPYVVVHSRRLDVDRNRVRGKLFKDGRFSLDMDFGGAVSVDSSRDAERQGMPDLDWMGEVGPALRYHAWLYAPEGDALDVVLPLRIATSVHALSFHHRGWVAAPRIEWSKRIPVPQGKLTWDSSLTAVFVDRGYAGYYYGVAPQYATAVRPAYAAPGGYAGWRAQLGVSWHREDMVYGAFVEHASLHGARFQASPLVSEASGWSYGVAVAWVFHHPGE
jgi:outer membrane protein